MKSSYMLLGVMWDGRNDVWDSSTLPYDASVAIVGEPHCLFDMDGKRRKVLLSSLLKMEHESDFSTLVANASDCGEILVEADYKPLNENTILEVFYQIRVRQILRSLERALPKTEVHLMSPYELRGCYDAKSLRPVQPE